MWEMVFKTSDELEAWLEEQRWFEDCHLLNIFTDGADGQPKSATIELGQPIGGSYEADAELTLRVFALMACGVTAWQFPVHPDFGIERTLESIESGSAKKGLRLLIDHEVTVHCAQLRVTQLPDRTVVIPASPSDTNFTATIADHDLPTPRDWVEWFSHYGENVVWRMYGEKARPFDQVPEEDYEGWFIQRAEAVAASMEGLFYFHCRAQDSGFLLSMRRGEASKGLWTALQKIVGSFPRVEVRSGNCRFSRQEWLKYLK